MPPAPPPKCSRRRPCSSSRGRFFRFPRFARTVPVPRATSESEFADERCGYAHAVRDWHAREFTIAAFAAAKSYRRGYLRALKHLLRDASHGRATSLNQ